LTSQLKIWQTFFNELESQDEIIKSPFKRLGTEKKKSIMHTMYDDPVFLRLDELKKLIEADVPEKYETTRDAFVLQCALGCRIGDFQRMSMKKVAVSPDGIPYVHYIPSKTAGSQETNSEIETPLVRYAFDIVKKTDFLLNSEDLDHYNLKMEAPTTIGDRRQYVVNITPRVQLPYALYYGKLYIDEESLAFTRAELELDMSDRQKATEVMLVRKPLGVRFRPKEMSLLVDYRQDADGLTRISYIRTMFRFNCDWKRRLFATAFTACCEMVVTNTTNQDVQPIRGRESFDQRDAFFDKVDYFRDPDFWRDYNIIEPTESLDKAIHRLLKRY
jgi:hypothetical protein